MRLRKKEGKAIHSPLNPLFSMEELFGSMKQKYDSSTGSYNADRTMTPFTLRPKYSLDDPGGELEAGDYTSQLTNITWTVSAQVRGAAPRLGIDYTIDEETHALTLNFNLDPDTKGFVRFSAEYYDARRKDILKAFWEEELECRSETDWKVSLHAEWPMRTDLMPWKDRGVLQVPVQLMNGDKPIADSLATYKWQIFENNAWRDVSDEEDFWYRGGKNTKAIRIEQKFVQRIHIRCLAWPTAMPSELQVAAFLQRRYYGFYDDDLEFVEGAYIFPETGRAVAEAFVEKRHGGRIANPEQYFDIEILYNRGDGNWWHVCHGSRGEVPRSMFPVDPAMQHSFGWLTREISALLPLAINGTVLTLDGAVLVAHYPVINRDFEE